MGERIKELRKALGLTQKEFGDRIGVKPNTIGTYEIGRNEPIDAVLELICREFNVNKHWLHTGEGEMFFHRARTDEITAFIGDILRGDPSFRQRFISVLARMTTEEWELLEKKVLELAKEIEKADP